MRTTLLWLNPEDSMKIELTTEEAKQILFELESAKEVIEGNLKQEEFEYLEEYHRINAIILKFEGLL
jgi:hypothetical protein